MRGYSKHLSYKLFNSCGGNMWYEKVKIEWNPDKKFFMMKDEKGFDIQEFMNCENFNTRFKGLDEDNVHEFLITIVKTGVKKMKKLVLALGIVLLMSTTGYAYQVDYDDVCEHELFSEVINKCGDSSSKERRFEQGVGVDLTLFEDYAENSVIEAVTAEYRFDTANGEQGAYVVARINLFQKIKRWLGKN